MKLQVLFIMDCTPHLIPDMCNIVLEQQLKISLRNGAWGFSPHLNWWF